MMNIIRPICIIFLVSISISAFSQKTFMKNPHVEIKPSRDKDFYYFDFTFNDQWEISRNYKCKFSRAQTDQKIHKFGIPESLTEPFVPTQKAIDSRKEIARDGLFRITSNTIEIDKSAVVSYYAKDFGRPIANFIKECLKQKGADNRLQRIEMAIKFVQDIPYGIPNWETNGNYYGGISTPPEILIYGYGDCDSKAFLFACILSYLIEPEDIIFVQQDQHLLTAIKTSSKDNISYIPLRGEYYGIAETSGPARYNFGVIDEEDESSIIAEKLVFQKDINRSSYQPVKNINRLTSKIIVQKKNNYRILFRNEYEEEINFLINFMNLEGNWITEGWYDLNPGQTVQIASTRNKEFYFYARCKNGEWSGQSKIKFEGKTYGFSKIINSQKGFEDLIYVLSGDK